MASPLPSTTSASDGPDLFSGFPGTTELESAVVDKLDEAWRSRGIKNRMEFFRGALCHYLKQLGAEDAAALFADATAA